MRYVLKIPFGTRNFHRTLIPHYPCKAHTLKTPSIQMGAKGKIKTAAPMNLHRTFPNP